ncbi:hypothetical protein BS47DRAFT_331991 [Hydnum rufescens UP504]|uniref:Altered inheritance of mitochondria protein 24, mitochondrial n=1 Tax=Hydnum rufescens UP504 TaxID=1448309 RepID=A0A9P6B6P2_9AGAM|nr:hypothetical protein BS47DRAFT_331991 [Hydnum rufescens UP504]
MSYAPPFQGDYKSHYAPPQGPPPNQYSALPSSSNYPTNASTALDTNGSFQGGQYRIDHRDSNTVLRFYLQPGAEIKGKPGTMLAMDASVQIKGKLNFSLKKLVTGSETKWKVGNNAFLAATLGVTRTIKGQGITKALFSGEGLVVYHVDGQGVLFVQSVGAIIRRTLQPGEQWIVDNGNLVAWSANYTIERIGAGGLISGLHTGEGFVCRFTGPGTVYIQTRNPSNLGSWIRDQVPGGSA